jgi:hypothetical protein
MTSTTCPLCDGTGVTAGRNCTGKVISSACECCHGSGEACRDDIERVGQAARTRRDYAAEELAWSQANRPSDVPHWTMAVTAAERHLTKFRAAWGACQSTYQSNPAHDGIAACGGGTPADRGSFAARIK